eukprot:1900897-Prorocentrum_lima.AAC.1
MLGEIRVRADEEKTTKASRDVTATFTHSKCSACPYEHPRVTTIRCYICGSSQHSATYCTRPK